MHINTYTKLIPSLNSYYRSEIYINPIVFLSVYYLKMTIILILDTSEQRAQFHMFPINFDFRVFLPLKLY